MRAKQLISNNIPTKIEYSVFAIFAEFAPFFHFLTPFFGELIYRKGCFDNKALPIH